MTYFSYRVICQMSPKQFLLVYSNSLIYPYPRIGFTTAPVGITTIAPFLPLLGINSAR